ncbi:MAG: S9 family peptidase [Chitinophagaceae bacterium]|nr:S9 family peptidase [Chitinophagaceae bacterium]
MRKLFLLLLLFPLFTIAQKKPLDHSVYDAWQSVGEKIISDDGSWIVYSVLPQEGDGNLFVQSAKNKAQQLIIPRGEKAVITSDSKYVIFKIAPRFAETREAKIKKKKENEMPKDSLGIVELGNLSIQKFASIKSFSVPEEGLGWFVFQKNQPAGESKPRSQAEKTIDSLKRTIDSLNLVISGSQNREGGIKNDGNSFSSIPPDEKEESKGSEVVLFNLKNKNEIRFENIKSCQIDKKGNHLALYVLAKQGDSISKSLVVFYSIREAKRDTILMGGNDFKNFSFSDDGKDLAFVAERGENPKALQKFYDLYLYQDGNDSAKKIVDRNTDGMPGKNSVGENGSLKFSKAGSRLFFGTAPVRPPKDTTLHEIDEAKLDIWNYKDDYLQPQQLARLKEDLKKSYLAVYDLKKNEMTQLGSEGLPNVMLTRDGNEDYFVALTDTGRRIALQWDGYTLQDVYSVNVNTGQKKLIRKNLHGRVFPSSTGKYILFYDNDARNYFAWDGNVVRNITSGIKVPLYDEENDVPALPEEYGVMGWGKEDLSVYIYDRYDIWKVDPSGKFSPLRITPDGRGKKLVYRYLALDKDERFLTPGQQVFFRVFNDVNKDAGLYSGKLSDRLILSKISSGAFQFSRPVKQKDGDELVYTKENYVESPDLYFYSLNKGETRLTSINPQQSQYNWGTAELYHWTTFDGKKSTGILYKPGDFDSTKKYPVLFYFYERLSDGLNNYIPPTPTPSRLNISFFVSRGYLVFAPDIRYTIGHPGKSAFNYIVSAAESLSKMNWVDGKNMGIQGQSWGGYQVAYLITATNIFKAAWSGAPVANMFSAYGGIRWQSGMNRQFQYEKTQSRIGATIWDRPDLYIENSPLFHLKNVHTPVVIMSNDADGAVPWYQGIEMFTALKRLGKPVWLLEYNGEAHNLVQRKNRKDISIREQQFFDWLLKGAEAPEWITKGVPAVDKGTDWGLGY